MNAEDLITQLQLTPHPEGGYYRETFRSDNHIVLGSGQQRHTCTAIYYLLKDADKSHFHRLSSDEIWLFHLGEPLEILLITESGLLERRLLGNNLDQQQSLQVVIPAHHWFAARLLRPQGYGLVSCIVAPGFDFTDFELADKSTLLSAYPHLRAEIEDLT